MLPYFAKFPTVLYNLSGGNTQKLLVDIVHRAKLRNIVTTNTSVYYPYIITESDTPEIIASKYYGNSYYNWLILLANNIVNPYLDWPMTYRDFQNTMVKLYGSIENAQSTIFQYYDQYGNQIDNITYNNTDADLRSEISTYDYYYNVNESKRNIIIIDKAFAQIIDQQLTQLLAALPQ